MSELARFLILVVFVLLVFAAMVYVLKRDSAVDDGKKPLTVKVPGTKYTLTPSRWFWRKVRENKAAVAGFVVVMAVVLWVWLK